MHTFCLRYNGQNEVLTSVLTEADAILAAKAKWQEIDAQVIVYTVQFFKYCPKLKPGQEWFTTSRGGYVETVIARV